MQNEIKPTQRDTSGSEKDKNLEIKTSIFCEMCKKMSEWKAKYSNDGTLNIKFNHECER